MQPVREDPGLASVPAAPADAVRIVPMHVSGNLPEHVGGLYTPSPHMIYRGGPVISDLKVFTVFSGTAWTRLPHRDLAHDLNRFIPAFLGSSAMEQLGEYGVPGCQIEGGRLLGTATLAHGGARHALTDHSLQHMLMNQLGSNASLPQPTLDTFYLIFLPPGVCAVMGGARSCQSFCGYHDSICGQILYGVVPFPSCHGCSAGLRLLEALTVTTSHILAEAITDPIPGHGWYDDVHGEIGDVGPWMTRKLGEFLVQKLWSNRTGGCV